MKFRHLFFFILGFLVFQSCQFDKDPYDGYKPDGDIQTRLLIDTIRDDDMLFTVFDSANGNFMGTEHWMYQGNITALNTDFHQYLVFRRFGFDSSGGLFSISRPTNGQASILEFNKQVSMFFLEGRNEKYFPQDSIGSYFRSELQPNGKKAIRTAWFKGVTEINHKGKLTFVHRASRDSTAILGTNKPYMEKRENYYYNKFLGLLLMTEAKYKVKDSGDSLIYMVVKFRQ